MTYLMDSLAIIGFGVVAFVTALGCLACGSALSSSDQSTPLWRLGLILMAAAAWLVCGVSALVYWYWNLLPTAPPT